MKTNCANQETGFSPVIKQLLLFNKKQYMIIDFNEVDMRIYLPLEKVIFTKAAMPR